MTTAIEARDVRFSFGSTPALRDASVAVADGISLTGRVISAAAAIMVCVFLSFTLGDERTLKEFGFGLAVAVFLDALVVRCVLLPAVLELLGPTTWRLPPRPRSRPYHGTRSNRFKMESTCSCPATKHRTVRSHCVTRRAEHRISHKR